MAYSDKRHPDKVERCNSINEDAKRREFTISCIYYYADGKIKNYKQTSEIDLETIEKNLNKHGLEYIVDRELRIIQDIEIIEKLFKNGIFQEKFFDTLITKYAKIYNTNKPTNQHRRVLIDPFKGINDLIIGKLKCV
jgi:tRNA nucleotidyltransferase/poly(A) polymerase